MKNISQLAGSILLAGAALAPGSAWAQAYPDKPIRLVVPYAPGGGADILARAIGQKLADAWKQPVVVDNKAGAGSTIGTKFVATAPADGYTLLMASPSHPINQTLYKNPGFDAVKDFSGVILVASGPLVLVVIASSPATTVEEFIAQAKAKPGAINYASAGTGSSPHLAGELLKLMAKVDLAHIAYKGTAPALADLMGGQVQAMLAPVPTVLSLVKSGRLKALAVTTPEPFSALPGVPAIGAKSVPGYEVLQWWGVTAPAGTPRAVINQLNAEIGKILRSPDMQERLAGMGAAPGGGSPDRFDELIRDEVAKWAKVITAANVKSE